jgi:hypothetical protein
VPSSLQGAKRRSNPKPRRTTGSLRGACHRAGHFRPGALARNDASTRVLATHPRPSSAKAVARMERSEIRGRPTSLNAAPGLRCAPSGLQIKREAERRQTHCPSSARKRRAARAEAQRASPVGVPPRRLLRRANATAQLQLRASWDLVGAHDPDGSKDRALFNGRYAAWADLFNIFWHQGKMVLSQPLGTLRSGKLQQLRVAPKYFEITPYSFLLNRGDRLRPGTISVCKSFNFKYADGVGFYSSKVDEGDLDPAQPWFAATAEMLAPHSLPDLARPVHVLMARLGTQFGRQAGIQPGPRFRGDERISYPGSSAASGSATDASASAAPWPRSAGCARGSPRIAGRLLPACGRCSCRCRSACAARALRAG